MDLGLKMNGTGNSMKMILASAAMLAMITWFMGATHAQDSQLEWRHAVSLLGKPKYSVNFKQYDYVYPNAPKGGTINRVTNGSFDTLNPYNVQGAPAAGLLAFGGGMLYDTLMEQSTDQGSTSYGLIAEAIQYPDDYSWVKFRLNPAARWHDGKSITAEDVIWSFNTLKKQAPMYNKYYADVLKAEKTGEHEVTFTFSKAGNRELPIIMGDLAILPQHWWEGSDTHDEKRDISRPTLEIPLGSGAYKIEKSVPGRSITWIRVTDYWGKDLPTHVGRNNFERIQYDYYRDMNSAWEAFKKGNLDDFHLENRIQRWIQDYNFPAVQNGDVIKHSFPYRSVGRMQAYFLNTRRDQFKNPKIREALNWVFDFQSMNRILFFDQYKRIESYFAPLDLAASGVPTGKELEILETVRDAIPLDIFTTEYKLPIFDTPQAMRDNLHHALKLFEEAGYTLKDDKLIDKNGIPFTIEFLGADPTDERIFNPFIDNLHRVGIKATLRIVDTTQYQARIEDFDYDAMMAVIPQTQSPGNEQRDLWGSSAANLKGSRNYAGIKNLAIDKLIDHIIYAKDREELMAATHALDRVLLWNYYVVPLWYSDMINIAYWNKFGIPEQQPEYSGIDLSSWWIDPQKEKMLKAKRK